MTDPGFRILIDLLANKVYRDGEGQITEDLIDDDIARHIAIRTGLRCMYDGTTGNYLYRQDKFNVQQDDEKYLIIW